MKRIIINNSIDFYKNNISFHLEELNRVLYKVEEEMSIQSEFQNLEARVTGSGDIEYYGNPIKKDTKVTGSGDIYKV